MIDFPYTLKQLRYNTLTAVHQFTYDDEKALEYFENLIKKNTGELDYKTNVKGKMTGWDFFGKDPEFKHFINNIFHPTMMKHVGILRGESEKLIQVKEAWGNILNKGDKVMRHHHKNNYYSTVIYFDDTSPLCTDVGKFETHRGLVITIEGSLYHWVEPVIKERTCLVFNWSAMTQTW